MSDPWAFIAEEARLAQWQQQATLERLGRKKAEREARRLRKALRDALSLLDRSANAAERHIREALARRKRR